MSSPAPRAPLGHASAFFQIFISALVSITALLLLWRNETDAVDTNRSLGDAPSQVVSLEAPIVEPVNEGRLIHASGRVTSRVPPQDTDLDLLFDRALVVRRTVEMYQWTETQNGASFKYVEAWSPATIDSSRFRVPRGHINPSPQIMSQTIVAGDVTLGDFSLSEDVLSGLDATTAIAPPATPRGWIREGNTLFLGLNPRRPTLGDIRVSYRILPVKSQVSIIARQAPASVTAYALRNGAEILMIRSGQHSADEMLSGVETLFMPAFWVVRITAFIALALGVFCALAQAGRLYALPLLSPAASPRLALQLSAGAAAGICASCMAIAWMFRLPFESAAALILCSAALIAAIRFRRYLFSPEGLARGEAGPQAI